MKTKKMKMPAGTKVTREFEFTLTEQESNDFGREMAKLDHGVEELELQFEEVKTKWKAKIQATEAKRRDISAVVHSQKQKRMVEMTLVKNYDSKEMEYWFDGAILEARTMTPEELQVEADFNKPKAVAAKARAVKQKLQGVPKVVDSASLNGTSDPEIADAIKAETSKRTKLSSVDGPSH